MVPGSGQIIFLPFTCIGYTATNQDFIQRLSTLIRQAIERQLPAWIEAANQREEGQGEQGSDCLGWNGVGVEEIGRAHV